METIEVDKIVKQKSWISPRYRARRLGQGHARCKSDSTWAPVRFSSSGFIGAMKRDPGECARSKEAPGWTKLRRTTDYAGNQ